MRIFTAVVRRRSRPAVIVPWFCKCCQPTASLKPDDEHLLDWMLAVTDTPRNLGMASRSRHALDPALLRYVGSREPHPYASTRAAPTHMPRIMPWIISCCACSFWLPEFFASKRHSIDRDLQSWLLPALEPLPMKADVSCGRMGAQESRSHQP